MNNILTIKPVESTRYNAIYFEGLYPQSAIIHNFLQKHLPRYTAIEFKQFKPTKLNIEMYLDKNIIKEDEVESLNNLVQFDIYRYDGDEIFSVIPYQYIVGRQHFIDILNKDCFTSRYEIVG